MHRLSIARDAEESRNGVEGDGVDLGGVTSASEFVKSFAAWDREHANDRSFLASGSDESTGGIDSDDGERRLVGVDHVDV